MEEVFARRQQTFLDYIRLVREAVEVRPHNTGPESDRTLSCPRLHAPGVDDSWKFRDPTLAGFLPFHDESPGRS